MSIVVIATISPSPFHYAEVREILVSSIPAMHAEEGCEIYALHETVGSFVFVEQWSDEAALEAHGLGDAVAKVQSALEGKLAHPSELVRGVAIPAGDGVKGRLISGKSMPSGVDQNKNGVMTAISTTTGGHSIGNNKARNWQQSQVDDPTSAL